MKNRLLFSTFILIIFVLPANIVLAAMERPRHAWQYTIRRTILQQTAPVGLSCAQPKLEEMAVCADLEAQILAATVRIQLHSYALEEGSGYTAVSGNISHATIRDGRYLVTHNHFGILLTAAWARDEISLSLFALDGTPFLERQSLTHVPIVIENAETVILDFGPDFFISRGFNSAEFSSWSEISLRPGLEVGAVNWDGATSFVQWAVVDNIAVGEGVPHLELSHYVQLGASGGGVFLNGVHIGNIWLRIAESNTKTGEVARFFSVAALNS